MKNIDRKSYVCNNINVMNVISRFCRAVSATADNGAQTGELTMNLADGNLTSSIILFPQTVASLPLVVNYKGQEYHATLTMPDGALLAGNNYTYTVKVRNKVLEVSEATIAKWNDIDGGDVGADL